jgi:catechol 2,3-dioxygenase-like lactoylglutathione lyase family enzyme
MVGTCTACSWPTHAFGGRSPNGFRSDIADQGQARGNAPGNARIFLSPSDRGLLQAAVFDAALIERVTRNLRAGGTFFAGEGNVNREAPCMSTDLDHTIVAARDKKVSAKFLADILGLEVGAPFGPFLPVTTGNTVNLDFMDASGEEIAPQHYAFLVSEKEFDAIFGRIQQRKIAYYADPLHKQAGTINHRDGGRGLYFDNPDGHNLEILTRRYGSGGS